MENRTNFNISKLIEELDAAVKCGDAKEADKITDILFRLQSGADIDTVMPKQFPASITAKNNIHTGGYNMKRKSIKKFICVAAAAVLIMGFGITALATHFFGISDMVINKDSEETATVSETATTGGEMPAATQKMDMIALQGYPDSSEYKASQEWNEFCSSYDTDHKILDEVGNSSNEYTEKYPTYLVYSKDMADKLEEIIAKYGLMLHKTMTIVNSTEELFTNAGTGNFLENKNNNCVNKMYGGYVYNDGTFQYDGEASLENGTKIGYQFGNYVKGTFSATYLNVGDANSYKEWLYTTKTGLEVSLALGESKALLIADFQKSFIIVNILAGTGQGNGADSSQITAEDLQDFADSFDFTQIK